MRRKLVLAGTFLVLLLLIAQVKVGAQNRPCADDVRKFCLEVTPGRGAIIDCLKPHRNELSEVCKKQLEQVEQRQKMMGERRHKARTARARTVGASAPTPGVTPK